MAEVLELDNDKQTLKRRDHLFQPGNKMSPGRPAGTANKLSIKSLLNQLSDTVGLPYEQQLAQNYKEAILSGDRKIILAYDNLFLSKLLADKVDVTVENSPEQIDAKREAFMAALNHYGQTVQAEHNAILIDAVETVEPEGINHTDK